MSACKNVPGGNVLLHRKLPSETYTFVADGRVSPVRVYDGFRHI